MLTGVGKRTNEWAWRTNSGWIPHQESTDREELPSQMMGSRHCWVGVHRGEAKCEQHTASPSTSMMGFGVTNDISGSYEFGSWQRQHGREEGGREDEHWKQGWHLWQLTFSYFCCIYVASAVVGISLTRIDSSWCKQSVELHQLELWLVLSTFQVWT